MKNFVLALPVVVVALVTGAFSGIFLPLWVIGAIYLPLWFGGLLFFFIDNESISPYSNNAYMALVFHSVTVAGVADYFCDPANSHHTFAYICAAGLILLTFKSAIKYTIALIKNNS
tara:strand:+ start:267 stop:614 length:348 start_codon:yes stop_codon:yes gene_type:complete